MLFVRPEESEESTMNYAQRIQPASSRSNLAVQARARFIMRTYGHLLAAILAFAAFEVFLFTSGLAFPIARALMGSGMSWLLVLGGFVVLGALFRNLAHSARSMTTQYVGLGAYVVLQAIIFVPLLAMAERFAPGAIRSAGAVTLLGFAGLTAVAFTTRKDFSFLGSVLRWGFIVALIAIVSAAIFGFTLGTFFSVAMVGLAGAAVLYDTSNVLHHFSEDSYVAAALELFASIAMMFWYVLRLFMASRD
jgi:FtsH-binding integral membrane protein